MTITSTSLREQVSKRSALRLMSPQCNIRTENSTFEIFSPSRSPKYECIVTYTPAVAGRVGGNGGGHGGGREKRESFDQPRGRDSYSSGRDMRDRREYSRY